MKIQSSTIPSLKEFYSQTHFILSNACQNVSILLRHYLQALGIQSKIVCGVLNVKEPEVSIAAPHVFMKIGDNIIDNTYSHDDVEKNAQDNLNYFIKMTAIMRKLKNYVEESPSKSKLNLFGGAAAQFEWNYMDVGCQTDLNQKKQVAAVMKTACTNPGTWIYDKLMRIYLKKEFNVDIESVENEMSKICWNCGLEEGNLKTCSGCKIAQYCDKTCISEDWKIMHKMMHKIITNGNNCAVNRV